MKLVIDTYNQNDDGHYESIELYLVDKSMIEYLWVEFLFSDTEYTNIFCYY